MEKKGEVMRKPVRFKDEPYEVFLERVREYAKYKNSPETIQDRRNGAFSIGFVSWIFCLIILYFSTKIGFGLSFLAGLILFALVFWAYSSLGGDVHDGNKNLDRKHRKHD